MTVGASQQLVAHVASALVICRDCGHAGVFFPDHFRRWFPNAEATTEQMRQRLRCRPCRVQGQDGRHITVETFPALAIHAPET